MPPKRSTPIAILSKKTATSSPKKKTQKASTSPTPSVRKTAVPKKKKSTSPSSASAPTPTPGRVAKGRTIVAVLMQIQCDVKIFHWQTHGFAAHKASDELHAILIEKIDEFVERFMGKYGSVDMGARGVTLKVRNVGRSGLVGALRATSGFLTKSLPGSLAANDTDLLTLRDDLLGAIRKTQYLLTLK